MHKEYEKIIAKEISPKVAMTLSRKNNHQMCHWLQIYGIDNFREGLIIAYEEIILKQQGNINSAIIQKQFLDYFHGTLEVLISSDTFKAFDYAFKVAKKNFKHDLSFDHSFIEKLLHDMLIACRKSGNSEKQICSKFESLKNYAYKRDVTYEEWCNEVILNTPVPHNIPA